ncbi:metallophosphoesterase [Gammaproteobacteria bacterium]|nr:metallophosphoesterase [Gammaproteobacteria bacterium]
MIRILLISDTHGDLEILNNLAVECRVDAIIHAGDFGFYDENSWERLPTRELRLRVRHSSLSADERRTASKLEGDELRNFVKSSCPLSELHDYLSGQKLFEVPVYAVWGNHEDKVVVEKFRAGEFQVPNLHILDEERNYRLGSLHIFGLGGNIIPGPKLFEIPLAGERGQIWSSLSQMERLRQMVGKGPKVGDRRLLVTHVSPGKEPLVWRMAAHMRADLVVSGHMGAPYCTVWNEFAVRSERTSNHMIDSVLEIIELAWREVSPDDLGSREYKLATMGMKMMREMPPDRVKGGRGKSVGRWTRQPYSINLPDAPVGHAILTVDEQGIGLQTVSIDRR